MASLLGKNWYKEPTEVLARLAMALVVAASKPTRANSTAAASTMRAMRRWPRSCLGAFRSGVFRTEILVDMER